MTLEAEGKRGIKREKLLNASRQESVQWGRCDDDDSMEGAEKIYSNLRFCSNVEAGESN